MNREWSALNKTMQEQLKKEASFRDGQQTLFTLRQQLMQELNSFRTELTRAEFDAMPFPRADGLHSKTIAYSIWHIARIEDIVAHTLFQGDEQVFFAGDWQQRIHAPIITTGNELVMQQIADFSAQLDLHMLYQYFRAVSESTEQIIRGLSFAELRQKIPEKRREMLCQLNVVSSDENAVWLIDYWCGKDLRGLIQMPFSRHWIMHTEACLRIRNKLRPAENKRK